MGDLPPLEAKRRRSAHRTDSAADKLADARGAAPDDQQPARSASDKAPAGTPKVPARPPASHPKATPEPPPLSRRAQPEAGKDKPASRAKLAHDFGTFDVDPNYDYKAARGPRTPSGARRARTVRLTPVLDAKLRELAEAWGVDGTAAISVAVSEAWARVCGPKG